MLNDGARKTKPKLILLFEDRSLSYDSTAQGSLVRCYFNETENCIQNKIHYNNTYCLRHEIYNNNIIIELTNNLHGIQIYFLPQSFPRNSENTKSVCPYTWWTLSNNTVLLPYIRTSGI